MSKSKKLKKSKKREVCVADIPGCHRIDFGKVRTIEDIKLILAASYIIVYDNDDNWDDIKHLMEE